MALQSSGAISISQIQAELGGSYSLRALSAAAGFGTPDAMSEFYSYASEYMTGTTGSANDAYISGGDYICGCNENLTVYQTNLGRWLIGPGINSSPLNGNYNLNSVIYNFSNGNVGSTLGYCTVFC